jgi:glycosyltransferase involved in cell wall biosynthesis
MQATAAHTPMTCGGVNLSADRRWAEQGRLDGNARRLQLLTFSSLFPSAARPRHGIFVETRLLHLLRQQAIEARVIAPVPWFPFKSSVFGAYAAFARTPREELRGDGSVIVAYPRYPMLPRVGVAQQPERMARATLKQLESWQAGGWSPRLIDAHYFYPDGVAAALVAERIGVPYVVTARGTDINVIAQLPGLAQRIRWAAERAAVVIAVAERLRQGIVALGIDPAKVVTVRNGVDLDIFGLKDPVAARAELGLPDGPLLGAVGNLVPVKDQALAIASLVHLPRHHLVIVGDGPLKVELLALGRRLGVQDRLTVRPVMPQSGLASFYACLDALLVTSVREGWPNVVLEALACGTPVVATDVGAVNEMLDGAAVGCIARDRTPQAVAAAVDAVLATRPSRAAARAHAAGFDWSSVSQAQFALFERALAQTATRMR